MYRKRSYNTPAPGTHYHLILKIGYMGIWVFDKLVDKWQFSACPLVSKCAILVYCVGNSGFWVIAILYVLNTKPNSVFLVHLKVGWWCCHLILLATCVCRGDSMTSNERLVWIGPIHDAASLRQLIRCQEPHTRAWVRKSDERGQVQDALVYTKAPKNTNCGRRRVSSRRHGASYAEWICTGA